MTRSTPPGTHVAYYSGECLLVVIGGDLGIPRRAVSQFLFPELDPTTGGRIDSACGRIGVHSRQNRQPAITTSKLGALSRPKQSQTISFKSAAQFWTRLE
jgi:hypothetical protein